MTSGYILKRHQEKLISETVHDLILAVHRAGLECSSVSEHELEGNGYIFYLFYVWQHGTSLQLPGEHEMHIEIYSTGKKKYDRVINGRKFFDAIMFQDISGREKMTLDILYEYFKLNPQDCFADDPTELGWMQWYYTAEDIGRIRLREFDASWCYKGPCPEEDMKRKQISDAPRLVSGSIIKTEKEKTIYEILCDVELAAQRAGLRCRIESEIYENGWVNLFAIGHLTGYVSSEELPVEEQLLLLIRFTSGGGTDFEWIKEEGNLFRSIVFQCISGREKMLLDFLYEYFKLNPQDYFVDSFTLHQGDKWYYTSEEIAKIKEEEYDPSWWRKKPQTVGLRKENARESEKQGTIPAFILKRAGEKTVHELLHDVRISAERAGLDYQLESGCDTGLQDAISAPEAICTIEGEIDDPLEISERGKIKLHIRSMEEDRTQYEWVKKGGDLIRAITFERVGGREEMLFYFLYEYLQLNLEDCFVVGNTVSEDAQWYYRLNEIEKIKRHVEKNDYYGEGFFYHALWCYKNPHIERKIWDGYSKKPLPVEFE